MKRLTSKCPEWTFTCKKALTLHVNAFLIIVLSPVKNTQCFLQPPAGATFLEHSACTKRCSPQLSTYFDLSGHKSCPQRGRVLHARQCLIPRKIIFQMILQPPEGAGFLEHCAGTKGCSPLTNHYPLKNPPLLRRRPEIGDYANGKIGTCRAMAIFQNSCV